MNNREIYVSVMEGPSVTKYYVIETNSAVPDYEIWSDEDSDKKDEAVLMATVYDEDFANEVVKLLNDNRDEFVDDELEPDEDFGEAVDEYILNDSGRRSLTQWEEDNS